MSCPPPAFQLGEGYTACTFTAGVSNPPNYPTSWECEDATTLACEAWAECSWYVTPPAVLDADDCVAAGFCPAPPSPPGDGGWVTTTWRLTYAANDANNPCADFPLRNPDQLKQICTAKFDASKNDLFALCESQQETTCGAVECCTRGPGDPAPAGPPPCFKHDDCPLGKVCEDAARNRADSEDFLSPGTCVDGCISCPESAGRGCSSSSGLCADGKSPQRLCPPGQICLKVNECQVGDCEVDGDCQKGLYCDPLNRCVRPRPLVIDGVTSCPPGFRMVPGQSGGFDCVMGCNTDADCTWRIQSCDWSIDTTWTSCNQRTGGCQLDYYPPCQLLCVANLKRGFVVTPRTGVPGCNAMQKKAEKGVACIPVDPNAACFKDGDIIQGRCG
jgi:hypothetical protein